MYVIARQAISGRYHRVAWISPPVYVIPFCATLCCHDYCAATAATINNNNSSLGSFLYFEFFFFFVRFSAWVHTIDNPRRLVYITLKTKHTQYIEHFLAPVEKFYVPMDFSGQFLVHLQPCQL